MSEARQYETIEFEVRGPIGLITLNRPDRLNAINEQMLEDLGAVLDAVEADDQVRVVVLHGAGRSFCSGFDLKDEAEAENEGVVELMPVMQYDMASIMRLWHFPKPTIAAAHGYAIAGGCELALACDLTVASEDFKLGEPDLRFGAGIVALLLPWLTGPKQAKELYFIGDDRIPAERCLEMGLINRVVPDGDHLETALEMAQKIAVIDTFSVSVTKRAINRTYEIMGMSQALDSALEAACLIEAAVVPEREEFMEIARRDGLKAAIAWRDGRFKDS
jgi:enoyl-CoA hydratase/carnithine racemase